ncbi:MAG: HEAT repeat domain-containing protein [Planctomycetes bacterium]|nr:HEAT repeat domain-containing protein [Planctomycetota bacterium]
MLDWVDLLDSPDPQVQGLAALSLLRCGHPKAKAALEEALKADAPARRQAAVIKAYGFDRNESALNAMEAALANKNAPVAAAASWALAHIGTPRAVQALCGFLSRNSNPERARIAAATALGQTHSKHAVEPLIACLNAKSPKLRKAALHSLVDITQNPSVGADPKAWQDWWKENRVRSREEWLEHGIRSRDQAVSSLRKEAREVRARLAEQTIKALDGRPDKKDPKPLIEALKNPSAKVRLYAVAELVKLDVPARVPALVGALSDPEAEIRRTAAAALGDIGDKKAGNPLIKALRDRSETVRAAAASSLGRLGCKEGVKPLIATLNDSNIEVASAAASALGEIGDKSAVKPLMGVLAGGKNRTKVREAAAGSLGKLGDPLAVKALVPVLRDKDERARWFAAIALGQLKAEAAIAPLSNVLSQDSSANVRLSAATSLGMIGSRKAEPPLAGALSDKDPKVAAQAAEALLAVAGEDFDALLKVGRLFYDRKDDNRAAKAFGKLVAKYGADSARKKQVEIVRRMLVASLGRLRQWNTARQHYAALCQQNPKDAALLKEYVTCLINDGDFASAIRESAAGAKVDPEHAGEWWARIAELIETHGKQIGQAGLDKLIAELEAAGPALGGEQTKARILKFRTPPPPAPPPKTETKEEKKK